MTPTQLMKRSSLAAVLAFASTAAVLSLSGLNISANADEATLAPALKAVQGVWVSDSDAEIDAKWTIENDDITATVNGADYVGKLKLDKDAKPHASWTIELTDGPGEVKGKDAKGVYKLDDEKLIVNIAHPGGDRPKDFDPVQDECYVFELKKEKKG